MEVNKYNFLNSLIRNWPLLLCIPTRVLLHNSLTKLKVNYIKVMYSKNKRDCIFNILLNICILILKLPISVRNRVFV